MRNAFLLLILTLFISNPLYASKKVTIQLGVTGFKPYSYKDPNTGECVGIAIDISKQILLSFNIQVIASCAPPARLYRSISNGTVDLSLNIKSTKALQEKVSFNTTPFDALTLNFYTNLDQSESNNKVAVIRGYDYGGFRQKFIDQGYELIDVANLQDAIRIFANNRTKYLISYSGPYDNFFKDRDTKKGNLELTNVETKLLIIIPTFYAISTASKHHDLLVDVFKELDSKTQQNYMPRL